MADVTLTAELRANIDGFERNINTAVNTVTTGSRQIDVAAGRAAQAIAGVNPAAGRASQALTNLGRVAQDAPFGFIGIANNLNPLLESFQRLRAEAGSNVGALRALGSSLIGAGGLGLALSAVTAIVSFAQMGFRAWTGSVKKAKEASDEYVKSLSDLRQAELKGSQNSAQEIVRLEVLYRATQNNTLSLRDRNAAYDELSSKYPKFFSNGEREQTLLGKNISSYQELTTAILAAAQAKAYEEKIGQNTNRILENRQKILDLTIKESKERANVSRLGELVKAPSTSGGTGGSSAIGYADMQARAEKRLSDIISEKNNLLTDTGILTGRNLDLATAALNAEQTANFKTGTELDDKNTKLKEQKTYLQQLEAQLKSLQDAEAIYLERGGKQDFFNLNKRERDINALIEKIKQLKDATNGVDTPTVTGTQAVKVSSSPIGVSTDELLKAGAAMKEYAEQKQEVNRLSKDNADNLKKEAEIGRELTSVFGSGLTDAFASALQGTQSFVSAMGQFLVGLVTKLLAAAAAAAVLAVILSAVGFGGGIGAATSSIGSFKNLFGSFSGLKLAEGGVVSKPTIAMIGEGGEPEAVIPLSKLDGMMKGNSVTQRVTFEPVILGNNIILKAVDRAEKTKTRTS